MSQTISLWGATYSDVPAVQLPTGSGTALFMDTSDADAVESDILSGKTAYVNGIKIIGTGSGGGGGGLVHVASLDDETIALADTDFNGWTPSSTAKAILPTENVGTFVATDVPDYDYFIRQRGFIELKYVDGTSVAKGMFSKMCAENWYTLTRRPSTASYYNSQTKNSNVFEGCSNTFVLRYYNTSWTVIVSSSYGLYPSNQAPSQSSTSATSPTVTVKRMIINAKCNATYFSTAMAGNVDQENSLFHFKYDIYRRESGYGRNIIYDSLMDMWNNGL